MSTDHLPESYRQNFQKLKHQVATARHAGLKAQSPDFIEEFANTYLACLSILSQLRSHAQWRKYVAPCQEVVIQANLILYPEESSSLKKLWHYLVVEVPAQFWAIRYFHLLSLGILVVTSLIGFIVVQQNFEMASVMMPSSLRSTHELEAYLFNQGAQEQMLTAGRDADLMAKTMFAQYLMMNNIKVALLCFVMGFLFGIPTVMILIQTGLMMGALPALFWGGNFVGLMAWLLPHGVPELSAIILSGGAGLKIGLTMLNPGDQSMGTALKTTLKNVFGTVVVFVVLLIWAGIVESFVRQSELSDPARLMIAAFSLIPLFLLFLRAYLAYRTLHHFTEEPAAPDKVAA